jgi:hypothetical protein
MSVGEPIFRLGHQLLCRYGVDRTIPGQLTGNSWPPVLGLELYHQMNTLANRKNVKKLKSMKQSQI